MLTGQARWKELMQQPVSRGEATMMEDRLLTNILSTATAIEALEGLLVKQGLLKDNELMAEVKRLLEQKTEQVNAAAESKSIVEV